MHLIHQNVPGLCWGDPKDPPILKTNTSRQRLNILGAYNPDFHSFVHLTGEENCDAKRVIEYFDVILKAYRRAPAIVLFLDNATYFKAEIVTTWLKDHPKLKLEFLPPYAPNLNLIERFWKFFKRQVLYNRYYEAFNDYKNACKQFFRELDSYVPQLRSLLTENFEIIGN